MLIFKKAKDIGGIILSSFIIGTIFYSIFQGVIGIDFNTLFLYRDNYSPSSNQIAVVKIDPESLDELEKTDFRVLSLSKTVYSHLIEHLEVMGVRAIGLDIIFANRGADEDVLKKTLDKYKNVVIGAWMKEDKQ